MNRGSISAEEWKLYELNGNDRNKNCDIGWSMFGALLVDLTQPRKESMNLKISQQKLSKLKEKKVGRKTTEHPRA